MPHACYKLRVLEGILADLQRLPDAEVLASLKELSAAERSATAHVVAHLAEIEARRLHLKIGFGSLFVYCRDALAQSEHESYNRIEAARAARRFPVVLDLLNDGSVNLTTIRLLAPHLTQDNHKTVLESARGKRKLEVEEIVARIAPLPEAPSWIHKLPAPRPATTPASSSPAEQPTSPPAMAASGERPLLSPPAEGAAAPSLPSGALPSEARSAPASTAAGPAVRPSAQPAASTTPLAPERYRLQVTIDRSLLEKIRLAKDMLGHAVPSGDDAAVLDRALTVLLLDLAKKRFAATDRPRPSSGTAPDSRHIPAEVKRAVWVRDLGRCAFVGAGRRCEERRFLEFHHVKPYAVGGEPTAANIQLRCRKHNDYEARVYFARDERGPGEGEGQERAGA